MYDENTYELCALCEKGQCAEDSHIIPKMVYRWLKRVSLTGYMRATSNPNLRTQDGPKTKLLCPACEDAFSVYETEFSNRVFHPINSEGKNDHKFDYEEWFHRFAVSVSWRALIFLAKQDVDLPFPFDHGEHVDRTLKIWQAYLNGKRTDVGNNIQHLMVLDEVASSTGIDNDHDLWLYIQRGIDFNTMHSEKQSYIFTKLGKIMIGGVILNEDPEVQWIGTEINLQKGSYRPGYFGVSSLLFSFMKTGVDLLRESRPEISENQINKMNEAFFRRFGISPLK